MKTYIDTICASYIEAACFCLDIDGNEVDHLAITPYSIEQAKEEIAIFIFRAKQANVPLELWTAEQLGHDLWFTRNGHGVGFWDKDIQGANRLSQIARNMGESYLMTDGAQVHLCPM